MRPTARAGAPKAGATAAAGDSRSAEPAHSWRADAAMACPLPMPQAPAQDSAGTRLMRRHPAARCLEWRSARLGNHRRVWIYTTGEAVDPQTRPLAILLDGQFWAESMPVRRRWPP